MIFNSREIKLKSILTPILFTILSLSWSSRAISQQGIGLQLYTFRAQLPKNVPGVMKKIHDMGITELEGGGTYGMTLDAYKELLRVNNLKIISTGGDFDQLQTDIKGVIDEAKTYDAKYVVCYWIPHQGTSFTIEETKKAVEVFNEAGKILKENGLTFCYHPHGYEFRPYENGTLFDYLATQTNPEFVSFEMDVFWVKQPGQDPVALLKKYPGRFKLMHLKDRKPGTPGNQNGEADVESNVVLGTGDVGIAAIMAASKAAGVEHYFIEDESSRSMEQVPMSLAYLKGLGY